jgi:hypothetical protein
LTEIALLRPLRAAEFLEPAFKFRAKQIALGNVSRLLFLDGFKERFGVASVAPVATPLLDSFALPGENPRAVRNVLLS